MDDLSKLREEIDAVDNQLLQLLKKRIEIVKRVGDLKKKTGQAIVDASREQSIIDKRSEQAKAYGIDRSIVEKVWRTLFQIAYTIEEDHK